MTNVNNNPNAPQRCTICGGSFSTKHEKEEHLRLHCVLCKELFDSRNELLDHMKEHHQVKAANEVFWALRKKVVGSSAEDETASEDELDLIEYWREHRAQ